MSASLGALSGFGVGVATRCRTRLVQQLAVLPACMAFTAGGSAAARPGRRLATKVEAAKKGGKGGGGQKKPGSLLPAKPKMPYASADVIMHNLLLIESFSRQLGRPMMDDADITEIGKLLWEAPYGLISSDRYNTEEEGAQPKVVYANQAALDALEAEWHAVVGKPLGEFGAAEEDPFGGKLKSSSDKSFKLLNTSAWKVEAPSGKIMGEAAVFDSWEYDDGTIAGPGAPVADPLPPTADELAVAEAAVAAQAEVVRQLKQDQGLGNKDPKVVAEVAVLMERKQALDKLQQVAEQAAAPAEAA